MVEKKMRYITLYLFVILLAVYAIQVLTGVNLSWQVGSWHPNFVFSWFAHSGAAHLLGNLFALLFFGLLLEYPLGTKKFLLLIGAAGVAAHIAGIPAQYSAVIGASGWIYGIIGGLAVLRPRMVVWLGIPAPMMLAAVGYIITDSIGLFANTGTGHAAHIAGAVVGGVLAFLWRKDVPEYRGMQFPPARRKTRKDPILERQLDQYENRYFRQ